MSKAARRRARRAEQNKAKPQSLSGLGWGEVYEAAERYGFDGYFYIPTLTPSEKMEKMTRRAIQERSDWLCDNCPPVSMAIDAIALDEAGTGIWPKWISSDPDAKKAGGYNEAMTEAYHYANHDPRFFSADGRQECYGVQYAIRRVIARYGDGFGQLFRPLPGNELPSMGLYPGYIVNNFGDEKPDSGWIDGVLENAQRRPIRYRVLNKEHATGYQDVEANDLLHFYDPFLPGQRRGLPALTPVCKKLFRMEDIEQAIADGTLSREMMGWAIENDKTDAPVGPRMPGAQSVGSIKKEDGSSFTVAKFFGNRSERGTKIPELHAGGRFRMLESNRPGTAVMEYLDSILKQLAWARKYPPEYVFFNAGGQGTGWRLVLQKVKSQIGAAREFQMRPQFLIRWHNFSAWMRIKSGYFDRLRIKVPDDWYKHKLIYPADMSVDAERVLRIYAELASKNQFSIDALHGMSGEETGDVEDANLGIVDRRLEKLEALNRKRGTSFTYFEMWPPSTNAPTNAAAAEPVAPPTPPKKKPD